MVPDGTSPGQSQELIRVHLSRVIESSPVAGLKYIQEKLSSDLENNFYNPIELRRGLEEIEKLLLNILVDDSKLKECIEDIRYDVENGDGVLIFCEYKGNSSVSKREITE